MSFSDNYQPRQPQSGLSGGQNPTGPSVGIGDVVTTLKIANQNMSQLIQAITALFPRTIGTFNLSAAATLIVAQPAVKANSVIVPIPTNASAATLMGSSKALYVSSITAGTGFTVATASGVAAAGTETFAYYIVSPV